jgi:putative peptide zinc metalloprotease protein
VTVPDYSALWTRVAGLQPRLQAHARIHPHRYRGQTWYVLCDPVSTRYFRFGASAYRFIGLFDGKRTVEEIWEALRATMGEENLSQADVINLLVKLHDAEVLQSDLPATIAERFARLDRNKRRRLQQRLARPLSLRFPLLDPEPFLTRWSPMVRPVFGPVGLLTWLLVVAIGLVLAAGHSSELTAHWASRAFDPGNLFLLWLLYPIVKTIHELGHAFATKRWGGEVHEMGIMLLVFMPIPYVDASAANAFAEKRRRMTVAAAGIMVEVFLSAAAIVLFLNVQPGLVKDLAFDILMIGGLSTLLFNGNPLLRFDGYYVLADALEIPNLGTRSTQYLGYLVKRYLFGLHDTQAPPTAAGEKAWLVAYGIASAVYRLGVLIAIALFVAGKFFVVGVLLAGWVLIGQVVYPLGRYLAFILRGPSLQGRRRRPVLVLSAAALLAFALLHLLPLPTWTSAEGIIRLPERSVVRAGTDGFLAELLQPDGQKVQAGEPLFRLDDPELRARISVVEWRLPELQAQQTTELLKDRVQSEIWREQIASVEAELTDLRKRLAELTVRSPSDGVLIVPRSQDLLGRFVRHGDVLGYVADFSKVTARVVVPQTDVDLVRQRTEAIEVKLANRPGETLSAQLEREVPAASRRLPAPVLGSQGGGAIAVDARDAEGLQTIGGIFEFDLALPAEGPTHIGSRVYVRFRHGEEPLSHRWYRRLRQVFLARFQA